MGVAVGDAFTSTLYLAVNPVVVTLGVVTLGVVTPAVTPPVTQATIFSYNCNNGYFRKYGEDHSYSYGIGHDDGFALCLWVKVVDKFVSKLIGCVKEAGGRMNQESGDLCARVI